MFPATLHEKIINFYLPSFSYVGTLLHTPKDLLVTKETVLLIDTMTNNNATMTHISDVHDNMQVLGTQPATQSHLANSEYAEVYTGGGILEIMEDGFGILRGEPSLPNARDVYISASQIRRFSLRPGDYVTGQIRPPK